MASRMNELQFGSLEDAHRTLNCASSITLEETQSALINAISHIRALEHQVERLQNQVGSLLDRGN